MDTGESGVTTRVLCKAVRCALVSVCLGGHYT